MRFSLFFLWLCNLTSVRWKQAIFQLRVFNKHMTWTVLGIGEQRFCYAGSTCLCCRLEHTELKWTEVFHVTKGKYCLRTNPSDEGRTFSTRWISRSAFAAQLKGWGRMSSASKVPCRSFKRQNFWTKKNKSTIIHLCMLLACAGCGSIFMEAHEARMSCIERKHSSKKS